MIDRGIVGALGMSLLGHGLAFVLWNDAAPPPVEAPQLLEARLVVPAPEPLAAAHPPAIKPPVESHAASRPHPAVHAPPQARAPEKADRTRQVEGEAPPRLTSENSRDASVPTVASGGGATPAAPGAPTMAAPIAAAGAAAPAYAPPSFGASYLHNPKPSYPLMARRRGLQGLVRLDVKVNVDGIPTAVKIKDSSGHEALDEAALTAVWHWRFAPARRGGEAVEGSVVVPVRFNLDGESPG